MAAKSRKSTSAQAADKTRVDSAARPAVQTVPGMTVAAIVLAFAAAWFAAGSVGLYGHALRRCLVFVTTSMVVLLLLPSQLKSWEARLPLIGSLALGAVMIASPSPIINVLAVALIVAVLAAYQPAHCRFLLLSSAAAIFALAMFRFGLYAIPTWWQMNDRLGQALGAGAGLLVGQQLWVGATFGGVDFLVLMGAFYGCWLFLAPGPRLQKGIAAALAIIVGHLIYLWMVVFHSQFLAALPAATATPQGWVSALTLLIPWNLPVIACLLHCTTAAVMMRWGYDAKRDEFRGPERAAWLPTAPQKKKLLAAVALAALLPMVTVLSVSSSDLDGKKVVIYEEGFLNWLKPEHGRYGRLTIGMYGMLPIFIESLGAECVVSPDLSAEDLADADVVILLYPDQPWREGQLDRIWEMVRRGGGLLVMGEHTTLEKDGGDRFNDVLEPTNIRVLFDSATFAVGGWLQSYHALAHPTTTGVADDRNQLGVVIGASVKASWPARPLMTGRWGWADPGDKWAGVSMMGNHHYDPGEKLGDLQLAAEQPLGRGRVIAFGDTSGITNGINVGTHPFNARLLTYLAGGVDSPQAMWRQLLGLLIALGLLIIVFKQLEAGPIIAASIVLTASLSLSSLASQFTCRVLPDGRGKNPNNLAYIDNAHIEATSSESWRLDGTMAMAMTLMRNGYLTLNLMDFTEDQLEKAGMLVSIAPTREYSKQDREIIKRFVDRGGIFITMVGGEHVGPSRALLDDLGFKVGGPKGTDGMNEMKPMGHFKAPFLNHGDESFSYVRFHAAWPISCSDPNAARIANGAENMPVIMVRRYGDGTTNDGLVAVIGDSLFAANMNLEQEGGEPFEGLRENADFWRWFVSYLTEQTIWAPLKPELLPVLDVGIEDEATTEVTANDEVTTRGLR